MTTLLSIISPPLLFGAFSLLSLTLGYRLAKRLGARVQGASLWLASVAAVFCLALVGCDNKEKNASPVVTSQEQNAPPVATPQVQDDDQNYDNVDGLSEDELLGKKVKVEGRYLDGTEIDWNSYRGKYVLVDFWTTWCGFCIREIPFNAKLYERYHDAGFEILAYSCDDDLDALRVFAAKHKEPWKIASSVLSKSVPKISYADMESRLHVNGYPTMILFDPDGKIVDLNARGKHLKELLEKAFPDVEPLPDEESSANADVGGPFSSQIGKPMKLEGVCLDGSDLDWESYRGKYVLVDFWTTWCGYCIQEIPFNKQLYDRYHDAGFDIVAYSCDSDLDALKRFAERNPEPWTIVSLKMTEEAEKMYLNVPGYYRVNGYPTMVLVDPEGKIVDARARGVHLKELLEEAFPDVEPILTPPTKDEVVSEKTLDGVKYGLAKKSVLVLGAEEKADKLIVPDKIDGLPVLAIADSAFRNCSFSEVSLPQTLLAIGSGAFNQCNLPRRVEIPDAVETIGWSAFAYARGVEEIKLPSNLKKIGGYSFVIAKDLVKLEIDEESANFKCVDGVLFTKDGSDLIAYPDSKADSTSYVVPDGVRSIEGGAFDGNQTLSEITLPSSLEDLDVNALPDNSFFKSVTVPENVARIDAVVTGSGRRSFTLKIDPKSEYFKEVDGVVFDKSGKRLVYFPTDGETTYRVPDGVETITRSTITQLRGIYIPASVTDIDDSFFKYYGKTIVFAPKGSFAEEYAKQRKLKFVAMENGDEFPPEDFDANIGGSFETQIGKKMRLEGLCLDGSEFNWESYRGKYVLVDFWTTWCGFCIAEIPFNKRLYDRYHDAGFDIVAFSCDKDLDDLKAFAEKNPEPWTIVSSQMSSEAEKDYLDVPNFYEVNGYPTMVLVDPEGKIVDAHARGSRLKKLLEEAFPDVPKIEDEEDDEE